MNTNYKNTSESRLKNYTKDITGLLLWSLAVVCLGYFSGQYYNGTSNNMGNPQVSIKMKNGTPSTFLKIEANKAERIMMNGNSYSTYTIDLKASRLAFYHKTREGRPIGTFEYLYQYLNQQSKDLIFVTNGGIYTKSLQPLGLYVENSKEIVGLNKKGADNFYLEPNSFFLSKTMKLTSIPLVITIN
jgi:uncharacterized protein YigE (DUF2233 family)